MQTPSHSSVHFLWRRWWVGHRRLDSEASTVQEMRGKKNLLLI